MTDERKAASNAEVESAAVSADAIAVLLSENTDIEDSSYVAVQIASLIEAGLAATLDQQVKHMVERFLRWRLPENFNPDCGITFKAIYNEHSPFGPSKAEPVGTNLFDYTQAEAMVRHMLAGLPVAAPPVEGWRPHPELIAAAVAFLTRYDGGLARIRVNGNMMDAKSVADALTALPKRDPDHVYNIDDWEFTSDWDDRINLTDDMPLGSLMHVGVLYDGPPKWAAHVPVTWDDDGDPDDTEVQWFDSKADAEAALGRKPTQPDSQGGEDAR